MNKRMKKAAIQPRFGVTLSVAQIPKTAGGGIAAVGERASIRRLAGPRKKSSCS